MSLARPACSFLIMGFPPDRSTCYPGEPNGRPRFLAGEPERAARQTPCVQAAHPSNGRNSIPIARTVLLALALVKGGGRPPPNYRRTSWMAPAFDSRRRRYLATVSVTSTVTISPVSGSVPARACVV